MTQFWTNFKGRFLGPSSTDANQNYDIWSGNICPSDICPHQQHLSCCWPNFKLFGPNFVGAFILVNQHFFWTKLLLTQIFFGPNIFSKYFFRLKDFVDLDFLEQNFILTPIVGPKTFLNLKFFWPKIFLALNSFEL